MKLSSTRKAEIVELVEVILEGIETSRHIDLEEILSDNNIECNYDHFEDEFDALIVSNGSRFVIHVNLNRCVSQDSARARFSIAHELGHFFIEEHREALLHGAVHGSVAGLFDSNESKEEAEADFFAANLLMPPHLFSKKVDASLSPVLAIKKLQEQFKTSLTATALQYLKLSASGCMIVKWNIDGERQWEYIGDQFREKGYRKVALTSINHCPEGSATKEVLSTNGDSDYAQSVTTASIIFERVATGGYRDLVLMEEVQKLGQYGFLSFFSELQQ